jgi:Trk-type K+ transport system membrane component
MNKRPLSVTFICSIYMAAGAIGFACHFTTFKPQ